MPKQNMLPGFDRLLGSFTQFAEVPGQEAQKLRDIVRHVVLPKGEVWLETGTKPTEAGFMISGLMRLYYVKENGAEYTKDFCTPGDFVSSYAALMTDSVSDVNIEALQESELLVVGFQDYMELSSGHICWATSNSMFARWLFLKKDKRERDFLVLSPSQRYQQFVESHPEIHEAIPLYQVASYLGISPVSLSRIRARRK